MKKPLRLVPTPSEEAPTSDVLTFLIADVRGYTQFAQERGDEAAARLAAKFAAVVREELEAGGGQLLELRGDEGLGVFRSPRQALRTAVELQARFSREEELDPSLPLRVGIGLDAGEAVRVDEGYRGGALNLAARLCSLAGPREVLASEGVIHLARKMEELDYVERGLVQLKGFAQPVGVVQIAPSPSSPLSREAGEGELGGRRLPGNLPSPAGGRGVGGEGMERPLPIGGFLGALPSGELVAREEELERVQRLLDLVAAGTGQLVLLAGEPGVGKTRLAQEVTLNARDRGFLVGAGTCYEPQQAAPFYPFLEALAAVYAGAPAAIRAEVPRRWSHLGRLLPNESIPLPAPSPDRREEHQRLFWAVSGFLREVGQAMPLALLLDDLHWADGSSLDLLQHVVRQTRGYRVLLLGTYRDVEVDRHHPLERALLDLDRQRLVERVAIRRLGPEGTAALVSATLGTPEIVEDLTDLLHRQTEGNPFFVQQMLRDLVERGEVYRENGEWTLKEVEGLSVPESVRAVIGQRVSRLSEEAQHALHEASVFGQTFAFDDLLAVDGRTEEELENVLEEAVQMGLLRETAGDGFAFNHALTQHALYSELPARRKRRLHLAAAEALSRLPEKVRQQRATELTWHFLEAGELERALPYAMLVGDRAAASFAHGNASTYYRTALDLARQLGDQGREAEAREKLGGLLTATIRYAEALEELEQAAQLYRAAGDVEAEAWVVAQIGRVHFANATTQEGLQRVQGMLESYARHGAPQPSPAALAALNGVSASLLFARDRYQESLERAHQAVDLGRPAGASGVLAEAEVRLASVLPMLGRWREGLEALGSAVGYAEQVGDLFSLCRGLQYMSGVHLAQGRLEASRGTMERALHVAERMDNRRQIATTTYGLGLIDFLCGDWNAARVRGERALDIMRSLGGFWLSVLQAAGLSLALERGQWEAMPGALAECIGLSERGGNLPALREERILAEQELIEGRAEAAVSRLSALVDQPELEEQKALGLLPLLARAFLESGNPTRAEELLNDAMERARTEDLRLAVISWDRVRGTLRSHQGRWDEADRAFEESLSFARQLPYPYAEAQTLAGWGRTKARQGDAGAAAERLREAATIFERLGAAGEAR